MKILILAPYPPCPPRGGGRQRMFQFVRHIARDHEVWLLTFSPSAEATRDLAPLHEICHVQTVPSPRHTLPKRFTTLVGSALPDMALRGRSAEFRAALDRLLHEVDFDVVQAESIEMAQYGAQGARQPLFVYDAWNAEYLIQQRAFQTDLRAARKLPVAAYSLVQWQKLRRYESQLDRRFAGAFAVSAADGALLRSLAPRLAIEVVPNGVDTEYFQPTEFRAAAAPYVLFTGTLDYRANIDAVFWFAQQVLPLIRRAQPDLRFVVVGRNPARPVRDLGQQRGVEIVGEVADVRPWFDGAAAYVVPMRIGGGVRLKLLEALAMARPVISTSMGVEGVEGLHKNIHALVADQPDDVAAQVLRVLRDRDLAAHIAEAGRALVVERYDWRALVPRMVTAWERWIKEQGRA